ncbi:hypothetical protein [Leptolyngbya sp. ST-U4]|uniref:hypothetical protein n=1 Tax=Leptolyngbya sp. ST-U4 TaxID=2933912 RepID=UPI0032990446
MLSLFMPLALMQQPSLAQTTGGAVVPLPRTDQVQLQLVNCGGWGLIAPIDCGLSRLFLPTAAFANGRQLRFDNTTSSPLNISNAAVDAEGVDTRYQLTDAVTIPQGTYSLPARQISSIPLELKRSAMPPDLYTGAIYLTPEGDRERFVLPLNISVRSGALVPLLLLLLGIILGQFFKYWQERGEPQTKALEKLYRLKSDIAEITDSEDKQALISMTEGTRKLISRYEFEKADADLALIYNRLDFLKKLKVIENSLKQPKQLISDDDIEDYLDKITEARNLVRQGTGETDAKAKELLEFVSNALGGIRTRGSSAGGDLADENHIRATEASRSAKAIIEMNGRLSVPSRPKQSRWHKVQEFLVEFFGFTSLVRAEANYWLIRPFLWLTLLTFLSLIGMMNLYVDNGTTFGAKRFSDYFALVLWGLSANVASSSISNLPVLRGQKGTGEGQA